VYYRQRRRLYSQNFLRNPKLVDKLIRNSSIGRKDTVLEIGPGKGIITSALLDVAGKVITVERDQKLYFHLKERFSDRTNLELVNQNFLKFQLPVYPYKVFSNTPFIITADVVRKLTPDENLAEAYLVVQKEAAKKFIGKPYDRKNSMMATLMKPWFDMGVVWKFRRSDFISEPRVDTVMLKIKRRDRPLIASFQRQLYSDFVAYTYNRSKVAKVSFNEFMRFFIIILEKQTAGRKKSFLKKRNRFWRKASE